MSKTPEFEFFPWSTDPIGKYKQPKPNPHPPGSGYPVTDLEKDNVIVKGRWPSGTKIKGRMDIQGAGAAQKGKKFHEDD